MAVIGLFIRRTRWLALAALIPIVVQAAGLGLLRADTFRYLVPAAIYSIAAATAVAFVLFEYRPPNTAQDAKFSIHEEEPADLIAN
jgi:hypothetical protein